MGYRIATAKIHDRQENKMIQLRIKTNEFVASKAREAALSYIQERYSNKEGFRYEVVKLTTELRAGQP